MRFHWHLWWKLPNHAGRAASRGPSIEVMQLRNEVLTLLHLHRLERNPAETGKMFVVGDNHGRA